MELLEAARGKSRVLEAVVVRVRRQLEKGHDETKRPDGKEEEEEPMAISRTLKELERTSALCEEALELRSSLEVECDRLICAAGGTALADAVSDGAGEMEKAVRRVRAEMAFGVRGRKEGGEDPLVLFGLWQQVGESVESFKQLDREAEILRSELGKVRACVVVCVLSLWDVQPHREGNSSSLNISMPPYFFMLVLWKSVELMLEMMTSATRSKEGTSSTCVLDVSLFPPSPALESLELVEEIKTLSTGISSKRIESAFARCAYSII